MPKISFESEKDLEDIIFKMIKNHDKRLCGHIYYTDHVLRQVNMDKYGIADLLSYSIQIPDRTDPDNYEIYASVIELKNVEITWHALFQALRYKVFLQSEFTCFSDIDIVLIGPSININSDFIFASYLNNISILTYEIDTDGITFFKHEDYQVNNVSGDFIDSFTTNFDKSLQEERDKDVKTPS